MPWTPIIQTNKHRQRNHKDCCGTHCSQTQKYPSNWCPTSHLNKNILSYKSYLIQFEEIECHTRCADIIKIREVWKETWCCEEKITIQKKIREKEAYAVPEKGIKRQSWGSPGRHKRDKRGKGLRTQLRIGMRSSPKTNHKNNQSLEENPSTGDIKLQRKLPYWPGEEISELEDSSSQKPLLNIM